MDGEADHSSRTVKYLCEQQTTIYGTEKLVEQKNNFIKATIEIDGLSASCNINALPDDLIENILLRLPLKDAVRTSVLSMRWRFIWRKLPHLIFANDSKDLNKTTERKLMEVNQVLLLHCGPIIKFLLRLADNKNSSAVEQLILRVSNSALNEVFLLIRRGEPYTLPPSLFSCLKLELLCLSLCVFRPPKGFKGFSKLVYLGLDRVSTTGTIVSKLISSCPLLEKFKFTSPSYVDDIEMIAPNLKVVGFQCSLRSLCFKNTPKLLSAVIHLHTEVKVDPGQPTLSGRLPAIEFLEMSLYYTMSMAFGKGASATDLLLANISNVKSLSLYNITFDIQKAVQATLMLIGHCPNLEKLKFHFCKFRHDDGVIPLHEEQLSKLVSLNHLREVELQSLLGMPSELNLINFLLANAPVLEKLSIGESTFMATQDTGTQFVLLLKQSPRASPRAKLSCNGVLI